MTAPKTVPFTLLTGFLGAGKTTVLNRVLGAAGGRRIAVLVNELGRIDIDSRLILSAGGDVLELAGGCICCKVDTKNDLWDGIADIVRRSRPDHVVLETTGIAEPPAVIEGLRANAIQDLVEPAGVVCVVDAVACVATMERHEEARVQLSCADRVLLSKLDVADESRVMAAHQTVRSANPDAETASFPATAEATAALVPWLLEKRALRARPRTTRKRKHQMSAASYVDKRPLAREPLLALVRSFRDRLVRVKGFVHVSGETRRGFLELAGEHIDLTFGQPWGDDTPTTELVFIGEGLSEDDLRRQLWACSAAPRE